jgi:hypothetical protein
MSDAYFTDAEVNEMCDGLEQDAAKIRYLRSIGLTVHRKPNGKPLAWRPARAPGGEVQNAAQDGASVAVDLQAWAAARKGRSGQKTQGR